MRLHFPWSKAVSTVTLAGALAVTGCGNDDSNGLSVLLPSAFPGTSVEDAFLGDDLRAFSNSGSRTSAGGVLVFRNTGNNDAIVVFQQRDSDSGHYLLMASWWNGSEFTAPVEILGENEDPSNPRQNVKVLFLNTSSFHGADSTATSNGKGRNGDAIITYIGRDSDDPGSADRDANDRAYATYFDRSQATKAAQGTVVHGFDRLAKAIDFDNVTTGFGGDPSVQAVGFVSDSLHGTHSFDGSSGPTLSGDATSFVQLAFLKSPAVGTPMGGVGQRWFTVSFDLGQSGNALPVQVAGTDGQLVPAVGAQAADEFVSDALVVNDGFALWRAERGNDEVVTASIFSSAATTPTAVNLGSDPTADDDTTFLPSPSDVYGPDHGVGGLYAFFGEQGFSTGATGQRAPDRDLMVAQIDVGGTSRSIKEIDAFTSTVSLTDADTDGYPVRSGDEGDVNGFDTRVHKNGGLISVLLTQPNTDATDSNDANATQHQPNRNEIVYAQVVQTGRPSASLGTSVLASAVKAPALESTGATVVPPPNTGVDQGNVTNVEFQVGLGTGDAQANGGPTSVASIWQTNPNRVWFRYTQYNDQGVMPPSTVPFENRLFVNGLDITPGADASAAPTAAFVNTTVSAAVVPLPGATPGSGSAWDTGMASSFSAQLVDNGDPAGQVWTFFNANDNHISDSTVMGGYASKRFYVFDGTATTLVSSAGTGTLQQSLSGSYIYRTAKRVHVLWGEATGGPDSAPQVATRSFNLNQAIAAVPALGTPPSFIDLPASGSINGLEVAVSGNTVGVYIVEDGHLYYNQTTSDAAHYRVSGGLSNPTLVDNDTYDDIQSFELWRADGDNYLTKSFAFWSKFTTPGSAERLQVRVHD